jgi:TfoX/Sxy family transcriptional regulator of competence genes
MAWTKPPPYMVDLFEGLLPADSRVTKRQMFGNPCGFVNGNMYCGLFEGSLFLRLSPADREEARESLGATAFEPLSGRPMREYVALPDDVLEDEAQLDHWMNRALAYGDSLPPKKQKPRKRKT